MATHDWVSLPLIVNFNDELKGHFLLLSSFFECSMNNLEILYLRLNIWDSTQTALKYNDVLWFIIACQIVVKSFP